MSTKEYDQKKSLAFGYKFKLPLSIRDLRTEEPFKTVKREYLIINTISLIGTVGGTLGLFIGFSFTSTSEKILEILCILWKKWKTLIYGKGKRFRSVP